MGGSLPITEDQSEAIAFLAKAANWPWPDEGPLTRHDTHGAVVFVGARHVLKLKRAVRFPYMDFSTIDRRRICCEAEIDLNRRTAPDLYLAAQALTREAGGGIAFAGAGVPLDWVVVMQRFDPATLFDRRAQGGELTISEAEGAARALARLHQAASPSTTNGGADVMRRTIEVNVEQLRRNGGHLVAAEQLDQLAHRSMAALQRLAPLIESRRDNGCVRRVHGDAHLGNLCLVDGVPTLFDCIEFNDAFAVIDIAYDLAFLLMDLWHRGLPVHANSAMNSWLSRTADFEMLEALPLFLSARAAIRAHVSASMSRVQQDDAQRLSLEADCRRYCALALSVLAQVPAALVGIGGFSGSGKSHLARSLAPDLGPVPGSVWLRSDVVRKELFGVEPDQPLPPEAYRSSVTEQVYARLNERAALALRAGQSVIVDAVHARPEERQRLQDVAKSVGLPFIGIWIDADEAVRVTRADARRQPGKTRDASDADGAVAAAQSRISVGAMDWVRLDGSQEPGPVHDAARGVIAAVLRRA